MDTPSDNPPNSTNDNSQNSATTSQPAAKDNHDSKPEATRENSPTSVFVNSEPVREDQVQNAVKFLSHPNDPTPSVSTTQTVSANKDEKVKSSSTTQPLAASQNLQPASALQSSTMGKRGYFSCFDWIHTILAVGIPAASGAGTALLFKHTIVPPLKSWIRKVLQQQLLMWPVQPRRCWHKKLKRKGALRS
ncbi:hypothetical protein K7X08_024457 [Anisodus acutangulus]|uniref:Peroxisomal membrane protein PEX14 n=1 Tax=Anisodus acutangulus TaxID=402998 RepID=A0A9Q1RFP9_9SOLA|nr:hypothetical protein K7X08_024457 [Anisodus acutangulus]